MGGSKLSCARCTSITVALSYEVMLPVLEYGRYQYGTVPEAVGGKCVTPLATEWLACKYSVYPGSKLQRVQLTVFCQSKNNNFEVGEAYFPSVASAPYCPIRTVRVRPHAGALGLSLVVGPSHSSFICLGGAILFIQGGIPDI